MNPKLISVFLVVSLALLAACQNGSHPNQVKSTSVLLKCSDESDCAIRFYFMPEKTEITPLPLVLRVPPTPDNKAAVANPRRARVVLITPGEMRAIVQALSARHLSWQESAQAAQLELSPETMPQIAGMEVTVTCHFGHSKTHVDPTRICDDVGIVEGVLQGRRPKWEVQHYLTIAGCKIPGFDPEEFEPK